MSSYEFGGAGQSDAHGLEPREDVTDPAFRINTEYSDVAGVTAEDPVVAVEPIADEPAEADIPHLTDSPSTNEADAQNTGEADAGEPPFTVVEIGAGGSPLLISPTAPDMEQLYQGGGRYIAVDANPAMLARGQEVAADWFIGAHKAPEAEISTEFVHADIAPGNELPEALQADSADRVIIGNVFTLPAVARDPAVCAEIARTASNLVRKEPAGEVVVIGLYSPSEYTAERVHALMASVGLERVGSDDMAQYFPPDQRDMTFMNPASYIERYRPRQETEEEFEQ